MAHNPFKYQAPEQLTPQAIANDFVEIHTDFPRLKESVNMFIHGARGTGKSMMLLSLGPAVQKLLHDQEGSEPSFYGVHVPIKQAFFGNPEMQRLKDWKATTVGEHHLTLYSLTWLLQSLASEDISAENQEGIINTFFEYYEMCGGETQQELDSAPKDLEQLHKFCKKETQRIRQYYIRIPDDEGIDIYPGALTSFHDMLLPFVRHLQDIAVVNGAVCLMVDDADNLTVPIQKVLNTWISMRHTQQICFKVSTQMGYKTRRTVDDRLIESPHDFSEVNLGTIYTSRSGNFSKRLQEIVKKRLLNAKIDISPELFFPCDQKQLERLDQIRGDMKAGNLSTYVELSGQGSSRTSDNVSRYATPALMRELSSTRSSHTYSYAGFQSLVDLSSGVVRWFLEPASTMFDRVVSSGVNTPEEIPVSIQNSVIDAWSREFIAELEKDPGAAGQPYADASLQSEDHSPENYKKLYNLIQGIGLLCRQKLLDKTESEQRVFSFLLSTNPSPNLDTILELGVRKGYFHKSDYASKNSSGERHARYILSRRLGPYFKLDISGYAHHLSIRAEDLEVSLSSPKKFIEIRTKTEIADTQGLLDFGE